MVEPLSASKSWFIDDEATIHINNHTVCFLQFMLTVFPPFQMSHWSKHRFSNSPCNKELLSGNFRTFWRCALGRPPCVHPRRAMSSSWPLPTSIGPNLRSARSRRAMSWSHLLRSVWNVTKLNLKFKLLKIVYWISSSFFKVMSPFVRNPHERIKINDMSLFSNSDSNPR